MDNENRFSALCKHYLILPHISRQRSIIKMQRVTYKSCEARSAPVRFTTGPLHFISQSPSPMTKNVLLSLYLSIEVHFFVCIVKRKDTGHLHISLVKHCN